MLPLAFPATLRTVLCLGAHPDDIEIGCGGTLLTLLEARPELTVHWVVLTAAGARRSEAEAGARLFLGSGDRYRIVIRDFPDGYLPYVGGDVKRFLQDLSAGLEPDLVFTHARWDRHQDHRLVNELTWNAFRRHLILEYEIPKYDGDVGTPNCFVPMSDAAVTGKLRRLLEAFPSQRSKHWFTEDTFLGLMRLRGVETGGQARFAEAFFAGKLLLVP